MSMTDIKDKVVLITGAGRGRGRLLAEAFAERGAIVAANDITPVNVEDVVAGIQARGGRAKAYVEDVAKKVAVQALVKQVEDDLGRIDILVNHAAVKPGASILELDEWDWHRALDVNLTGAFLMMQSVARIMREKGGGVILNLITETGGGAEKDAGIYLVGMSGLAALTELAARELSQYGVRVHSVKNTKPEELVEAVMSLCTSPGKTEEA